jgi:hypothetical protein
VCDVAAAAIIDTLRHLWCTIDQQKIPAAVVGDLALATWTHPRATRDVDVMVSLTDDQLEQLVAALVNTGFHVKSEGAPIKLQQLISCNWPTSRQTHSWTFLSICLWSSPPTHDKHSSAA